MRQYICAFFEESDNVSIFPSLMNARKLLPSLSSTYYLAYLSALGLLYYYLFAPIFASLHTIPPLTNEHHHWGHFVPAWVVILFLMAILSHPLDYYVTYPSWI